MTVQCQLWTASGIKKKRTSSVQVKYLESGPHREYVPAQLNTHNAKSAMTQSGGVTALFSHAVIQDRPNYDSAATMNLYFCIPFLSRDIYSTTQSTSTLSISKCICKCMSGRGQQNNLYNDQIPVEANR